MGSAEVKVYIFYVAYCPECLNPLYQLDDCTLVCPLCGYRKKYAIV